MSYTKGPWKIDRTIDGFRSVSDGTKTICTVGEADIFPSVEDDAALIAAAPELVEALADLVEEIRYRGLAKNIKKDFSLMNYLVQAEKALTKAKGGQP